MMWKNHYSHQPPRDVRTITIQSLSDKAELGKELNEISSGSNIANIGPEGATVDDIKAVVD